MKPGILLFIVLINNTTIAQTQSLNRSMQVDIGTSKHGTGDMKGFTMNCEYKKSPRKNYSFSIGIGATIHDGYLPISYSDGTGNPVGASYRYTTGGVQKTSKIGWNFLKNLKNEGGVKIGTLFRYQSSSYYDELGVYFPPVSNLPFPVISLISTSPQKTLSAGGIGQLFYSYSINQYLFTGVSAALQIDTEGDVINHLALTGGFSF
jgi:hypothetical protein